MKIIGDCLKILPALTQKFNLVLTDPPYNIGWNYGDAVNDSKIDYHEWCVEWVKECSRVMNNNGILIIINYPENNNILFSNLIHYSELKFIQQLIWNYNTNIGHSDKKYTRSYRTLLIYAKSDNYTFNPQSQPYKNPTDKRIKKLIENGKTGTNHYDILTFNLCKNVSNSKKNIGINQLPNDLVDFLICTYSNPGDWILDPFGGNMTIPIRAIELSRYGMGIDINDYDAIGKSNQLPDVESYSLASTNTSNTENIKKEE